MTVSLPKQSYGLLIYQAISQGDQTVNVLGPRSKDLAALDLEVQCLNSDFRINQGVGNFIFDNFHRGVECKKNRFKEIDEGLILSAEKTASFMEQVTKVVSNASIKKKSISGLIELGYNVNLILDCMRHLRESSSILTTHLLCLRERINIYKSQKAALETSFKESEELEVQKKVSLVSWISSLFASAKSDSKISMKPEDLNLIGCFPVWVRESYNSRFPGLQIQKSEGIFKTLPIMLCQKPSNNPPQTSCLISGMNLPPRFKPRKDCNQTDNSSSIKSPTSFFQQTYEPAQPSSQNVLPCKSNHECEENLSLKSSTSFFRQTYEPAQPSSQNVQPCKSNHESEENLSMKSSTSFFRQTYEPARPSSQSDISLNQVPEHIPVSTTLNFLKDDPLKENSLDNPITKFKDVEGKDLIDNDILESDIEESRLTLWGFPFDYYQICKTTSEWIGELNSLSSKCEETIKSIKAIKHSYIETFKHTKIPDDELSALEVKRFSFETFLKEQVAFYYTYLNASLKVASAVKSLTGVSEEVVSWDLGPDVIATLKGLRFPVMPISQLNLQQEEAIRLRRDGFLAFDSAIILKRELEKVLNDALYNLKWGKNELGLRERAFSWTDLTYSYLNQAVEEYRSTIVKSDPSVAFYNPFINLFGV